MSEHKPPDNELNKQTRIISGSDSGSKNHVKGDKANAGSQTVVTPRENLQKSVSTSPESEGNFDLSDSTGFIHANEVIQRESADRILNHRFVLQEVLGVGGMGVVYNALDLRKVEAQDKNPSVAVKVLGSNFQGHPKAFITLQREAAKSQSLSHPNIVRVHDFDRDKDKGVVYMTMEQLKGQSLDKLVRKHPNGLPSKLAWHIIKGIALALKHAHKNQLVHSDLKPGNIFITEKNVVKVLDFGIARALQGNSDDEADFDAGSLGALTPSYASLEMIQRQNPDARDDIYALAVVAYLLLTGKHPFKRFPADQAQQKNLKAKKIKGLSRKHWKVLEQGLAFERAGRLPKVDAFLDLVSHRRQNSLLTATGVFALISVAIGSYYYGQMGPDPQQELAKRVTQAITSSQNCFDKQDYDCAMRFAQAAAGLAPDNVDAQRLIDSIKTQITNEQINEWLAVGEKCFGEQKFDCTLSYVQQILALNEGHERAVLLQRRVETAVEQRLQTQQREQLLTLQRAAVLVKGINEATRCMQEHNYACVMAKADKVLEIDSENQAAKTLQKQAQEAQQQQIIKAESIRKILADSDACFQRFNYSCAIANAKAALRIDSKNREAKQLFDKAKAAQDEAKKSIVIE